MDLAERVRHYYLEHFDELPFDKQFHFATRLYSWSNDVKCGDLLERMKHTLVKDPSAIKQDLEELIFNPPAAKINAAETRAQYFARYPELRGVMLALFRVRHLMAIYGVDARETFLEIYPLEKLRKLTSRLKQDEEALRALSTYAINVIYLVDEILFVDDVEVAPVEHFYHLADVYDTADPEQTQLMIYLYTHCIIGASNFYEREVAVHQAVYISMLERLEQVIKNNYDQINLDNKLEFLVCCRILGFDTSLFEKTQAECEESVSSDGVYLVDTLNSFAQSNKTSFSDSEHRNVLYIMSQHAYHA